MFSTDGSTGALEVTVSNLATTSPSPNYYGVLFDGLTTGPAARENWKDSLTANGAYVITYEGVTTRETISTMNF